MLKIDLPRKDFAQKSLLFVSAANSPLPKPGTSGIMGARNRRQRSCAMQSETLRDGNCPLYLRERCRKKSGRRRGKPVLFWYEILQALEGGSAKPL